mmetsp:Transcript_65745/g.118463  ORF Transcript_65745/g.118463 Transcript_65745/m.118463 type:complete len:80 (-) Transcript_65745:148-387(-)
MSWCQFSGLTQILCHTKWRKQGISSAQRAIASSTSRGDNAGSSELAAVRHSRCPEAPPGTLDKSLRQLALRMACSNFAQ